MSAENVACAYVGSTPTATATARHLLTYELHCCQPQMPYEPHPDLTTPPDGTVIWRYLSFVKLMDLLERRVLWFGRLDTFEDPLEGTYTDAEVQHLRSIPPQPLEGNLKKVLNMEEQFRAMSQLYRSTMFINCWRAAKTESMAMWDVYGKGSGVVAIKSSIACLKTVLSTCPQKVFIGGVQYVDWDQIAWQVNALAMVMRKDRSYAHEQEVRAVVWGLTEDPPIATQSLKEGHLVFDLIPGVEVPCNPEQLITEIVVGPREQEMFLHLLEPILKRYGLAIPVRASDRLKMRVPFVS